MSMNVKVKKSLIITAWVLLGIFLFSIMFVGGYLVYVASQYYRIDDHQNLQIENNVTAVMQKNIDYTAIAYNIGFGAYAPDFSFFMDVGELNGKQTVGKSSKAKSKDSVIKMTNGVADTVLPENAEFLLFQEVDVNSDRAHKVNQKQMLVDRIENYSNNFALNFHTAYLAYPLFDHHGQTDAGLLTMAKFNMKSGVRRQLPVDESFPAKFFDLDRCFSVTRFDVEQDKEFVLINLHMSAYDEGGKVRAKQLEMLNGIMKDEKEKGNYVVIGGDFNHELLDLDGIFQYEQKRPEWVATLRDENLASGYNIAAAKNAPTCRSSDIEYQKGVNYITVIDGFVVSSNIQVEEVINISNDFAFSDHQPAKLKFKLI